MEGLLETQAEIHQERGDLQHGRQDPASTGGPEREAALAMHADRRAHVGERLPPGCDRVGAAGPRVEPHDAVVQQQARARRQELAAERGQQRLRQRHEVAVAVDHADVRGAGGRPLAAGRTLAREPLPIGSEQRLRVGVESGLARRVTAEVAGLQQLQAARRG